jgi:hypothetical protein
MLKSFTRNYEDNSTKPAFSSRFIANLPGRL